MEKQCRKCKEVKEFNAFYRRKDNPKGVRSFCKSCIRLEDKKQREQYPEKRKQRIKQWHSLQSKSYKIREANKNKEYRKNNPEKIKKMNRRKMLQTKYGMTISQYETLFNFQKGCCAICSRHKDNFKYNLAVDHDHKTGKIRQLLCPSCNTGLGNFKDSEELLLNAVKYLELHKI